MYVPRTNIKMLNAKPENVRKESQIVAQAGLPKAVTIATNMAGRGTDIVLGGNPRGLAAHILLKFIARRLLTGRPGLAAVDSAAKMVCSTVTAIDLGCVIMKHIQAPL